MSFRETNQTKVAKTRVRKEIRLARKLKEMEKKRLKDNVKAFHYEIKENFIVKVKNGD